MVALNKIDLVDGPKLGARLEEARALSGGAEVLPVSALRGDGLSEVVSRLSAAMPPGPVYFPEGQQRDQPLELLIAELVREQALASLATRCPTPSPRRSPRSPSATTARWSRSRPT